MSKIILAFDEDHKRSAYVFKDPILLGYYVNIKLWVCAIEIYEQRKRGMRIKKRVGAAKTHVEARDNLESCTENRI